MAAFVLLVVLSLVVPSSLVILATGAMRRPEKVVDMTHTFDANTIYWPTASPFKMTIDYRNKTALGFWYEGNSFATAEHGGTHLDAPAHFSKGKWRVDDIPPERFVAEGIVIDITEKAKKSDVAQLTIDDFEAWERKHGKIPEKSIVFMNSGWQSRWSNKTAYLGTDTKNTNLLRFPGFHPNAARWLVNNRGVYGIGVDTASIDFGPSKYFTVHTTVLAQNVYALENVANLDKIPVRGAAIYALPMKIGDGSGAPCRIFATWSSDMRVADGYCSKGNFPLILTVLSSTLMLTHISYF